jgi:DNA repair ATPase RecN
MQREDLLAKGYTEEQVTDYLNMYHNLQSEVKKANEQLTQSKALADGLQKQIDDINNANLSEQEKLVKERQEADAYMSNAKKIYNTAKAKEILAGYEIEDDIINSFVSDDENVTLASANLLKSRLDTIIANTTKKVQDNIAAKDVRPAASNVPQEDDRMTREKYLKMSLTEQVMFKRENPDLAAEFEN